MTIVQRRRKKARSGACVAVFFCLCVVVLRVLFTNNELETAALPLNAGITTAKHSRLGNQNKAIATIDVNAPPVLQESGLTANEKIAGTARESRNGVAGKSFFSSWYPASLYSNNGEAKPRGAPHRRPIPIVDDKEDRVPRAASGAVIRASDALLCHESAISYVVNATDLRDECDGLKKAFAKFCDGDDEDEQSKTERRLTAEGDSLLSPRNPILQWRESLLRLKSCLWWHSQSDLSWSDGESAPERVPRKLQDAIEFSEAEQRIDTEDSGINEVVSNPAEKKRQVNESRNTHIGSKEKAKTTNLSLPTTKHSVSEKMLGEALLLQREEKIISEVKAVRETNAPNETQDNVAAASIRAVSETVDVVSSVLNDPSSVEARTCCASILNVFHETCSVDQEEELSDKRLVVVVVVIALCGWVKSLIRYFQIRWLPEAAGCIVVGVICGWVLSLYPHHDLSFDGPWFLRIMLPPIVFEAALSIDKRAFYRHIGPILLYAILGTIVSTCLTAYILHQGSVYYHGYCETVPVIEALIFGSLISSIDPVTIISVLRATGVHDDATLFVTVFGESLLNDGVSIVLYQTLVHFLDANMQVDSHAVFAAIIHFFVVAIGSLLVGLASGICCTIYYWTMHGCQTPLVEVIMFCCWALIPYYICDGIEWSGIVAVVATGFVLDIYVVGPRGARGLFNTHIESFQDGPTSTPSKLRGTKRPRAIFSQEGHLSAEAKTHIGFVTEIIATMMETSIFAYLGLFLFSSRYHWNFYHSMIAIGACCLSRAVMIPVLSAISNWLPAAHESRRAWFLYSAIEGNEEVLDEKPAMPPVVIDWKMQVVLWFAGLRGAMSFALVESVPLFDSLSGEGTRLKSELKAMTSACIIFTVFVLGGSTFYMMECLGMAPSSISRTRKRTEEVGLGSLSQVPDQLGEDGTFQYDHDEDMPLMGNGAVNQSKVHGFRQRTQNQD